MPITHLRRFLRDEAGAVTVDWVVLTAGTLMLGMIVVLEMREGLGDTSTALASELSTTEAPALDFNHLAWNP